MDLVALKDLPSPPAGKAGWPWTEETPRAPTIMQNDRPWPKISIVTPNYNYSYFIEETIRSVLLQGYPNIEYIIIDDGSTDNSVEIIKRYEEWLAYWSTRQNYGQSYTINEGFSKAKGEIFAWINSDDLFYPGALQKIAESWAALPQCHFMTGDGAIVDSSGYKEEYYIKADNHSFNDLLRYHDNNYLPQPSVFFSKESFNRVGGLNTALYIAMDLDLWLRLRKVYPLHYVPLCLSKLRHHEEAKTWKYNDIAMKEVRNIIINHLDEVNLLERMYITLGLRSLCASAIYRQGIKAYFDRDSRKSIALFKKAISIYPETIFTSIGIRLFLRLILPMCVKKLFFKIP